MVPRDPAPEGSPVRVGQARPAPVAARVKFIGLTLLASLLALLIAEILVRFARGW